MILIILCLVPRVLSHLSLQHHVYVSRKSRSNSEPFETGYVYNQISNDPVPFSTFNTAMDIDDNGLSSEPVLETYTTKNYVPSTLQYSHPVDLSNQIIRTTSAIKPMNTSFNVLAKAESKYRAGFLPSKIATDAMYEQLKSTMHYQTHPKTELGYETYHHIDDDDVRTSSRGLYDSWPYYYHSPYEYEHMRIDAEIEKAKDKRYASDAAKIIPIHEDLSDDIPNSHEPIFTARYYKDTSTENPLSGHEPFFYSLLNDYFNKRNDYEDQLTFKEADWGTDFDHETKIADMDDYAKRNRRLPSHYKTPERNNIIGSNNHAKQSEVINSDSSTEKGHEEKHKFNKHRKNEEIKSNDKSVYGQNGQQHTAFKDFVDSFANKFGSEDQKTDSKYILKRNQDKGENRKGFRRVYHKDEYQEDKEFYDNNNSSAKSEDQGSSNAHIGGSEALLKSHASANLANQASAFEKSGKNENHKLENNDKGHDESYGLGSHFKRYRDVARKAAQSNDADYSDHYRI